MTITLFNALIQPRKRVEQMQLIATAVGSLKGACSIEDPIIEQLYLQAAPADANYMYIQEFGRYYFITRKESNPAPSKFWNISGHVDVLTTYWPQIANQSCILRRQTNEYNLYLPDPNFPVQVNHSPEIITFPKALTASQNGSCCVLVLVGANTD